MWSTGNRFSSPKLSEEIISSIAKEESMPGLDNLQSVYVRYGYSSSDPATESPLGWLESASTEKAGAFTPSVEGDRIPSQVELKLVAAPATLSLPVKSDRIFGPMFKVEVSVRHTGKLFMPIRVQAFTVPVADIESIQDWRPPELQDGKVPAVGDSSLKGNYITSHVFNSASPLEGSAQVAVTASDMLSIHSKESDPCMACGAAASTSMPYMMRATFEFRNLEFARPTRMQPVLFFFACVIGERDLLYLVYEQPTLAICRAEQRVSAVKRLGLPENIYHMIEEAGGKPPHGMSKAECKQMAEKNNERKVTVQPVPQAPQTLMRNSWPQGFLEANLGGKDVWPHVAHHPATLGNVPPSNQLERDLSRLIQRPPATLGLDSIPKLLSILNHEDGHGDEDPLELSVLDEVLNSTTSVLGPGDGSTCTHTISKSPGRVSMNSTSEDGSQRHSHYNPGFLPTPRGHAAVTSTGNVQQPSAFMSANPMAANGNPKFLPRLAGSGNANAYYNAPAPHSRESMISRRSSCEGSFKRRASSIDASLGDDIGDGDLDSRRCTPRMSNGDMDLTRPQSRPHSTTSVPSVPHPHSGTLSSQHSNLGCVTQGTRHGSLELDPALMNSGNSHAGGLSIGNCGSLAAALGGAGAGGLLPQSIGPTGPDPHAVQRWVEAGMEIDSNGTVALAGGPSRTWGNAMGDSQWFCALDVQKWALEEYNALGLPRALLSRDMQAVLAMAGFPQFATESTAAIDQRQFADFRNNFSSILLLLRSLSHLWVRNDPTVIAGLDVDRRRASAALQNHPPGTFVCRLSLNQPGVLVFTCKVDPYAHRVKGELLHISIATADLAATQPEDVILDVPYATHILDVYTNKSTKKDKALAPALQAHMNHNVHATSISQFPRTQSPSTHMQSSLSASQC